MSFEIIAGLVVVILGAIAGAFGIGHARGASKAKAKADQQRPEENAAAQKNEKLVSKSGALRHYGFSIPSI